MRQTGRNGRVEPDMAFARGFRQVFGLKIETFAQVGSESLRESCVTQSHPVLHREANRATDASVTH